MSIRRKILPCVFAMAGMLVSSVAVAQGSAGANDPFAGLDGSWSGSGTVRMQNGSSERLTCNASYQRTPSGATLNQTLRCRSDSYRVDLRTTVIARGAGFSGTFVETVKNVQGRITGQASQGQVRATAQASAVTVNLSIATRGNQQTISLRSQGNDSTQVSITLRRSGRSSS
jgi:hypothetical protein